MSFLTKIINALTNITKWFGMAILFLMMVFVFIAVVGRSLSHPIIGDVEVVQFLMIIVIMFSLAYTQFNNAHITIGLLVDKFPKAAQLIIDAIGYLVTIIITWTIGTVFFKAVIKEFLGITIKSTLLDVPFYPFKLIIAIGLFLWGLQALLKLLETFNKFLKRDMLESVVEEGGKHIGN